MEGRLRIGGGTLSKVGLLALTTLVVSVAALFLSSVDLEWTHSKIEETKAVGDTVAALLDEYFREHNEYPYSLDQLASELAVTVPNPSAGNEQWEYVREGDSAGYFLAVWGDDRDLDPALYRTQEADEWMMDTR